MGRLRSSDSELQPLETLRRLFDADVADRFHDAFAGKEILVPKVATPEHRISQAIGLEAAQALVNECGGCRYAVPGNRERRVVRLCAAGKSVPEIATELSITTRAVYRIRRKLDLAARRDATSSINGASR